MGMSTQWLFNQVFILFVTILGIFKAKDKCHTTFKVNMLTLNIFRITNNLSFSIVHLSGIKTGRCVKADRGDKPHLKVCEIYAWCPVEIDELPMQHFNLRLATVAVIWLTHFCITVKHRGQSSSTSGKWLWQSYHWHIFKYQSSTVNSFWMELRVYAWRCLS